MLIIAHPSSRATGLQPAAQNPNRAPHLASGPCECSNRCCPDSSRCTTDHLLSPLNCALDRCPGAVLDTRYNGSKPIIASTGARTVNRLVEIEEVATELTLDGNVDDVNLPNVRLVLARLYYVPVSAITLQLQGGSVVISVLIAEAGGTNLSEISTAVLAVNDTSLSGAIGIAVTRTAPPVASLRNVSRFEELRCARGHWCTAALTIECERGFYNPHLDADNQGACQSCPRHSTTLGSASTSVASCICDAGYYDDDIESSGVVCLVCMLGSACAASGTTLHTLPLLHG